LRKEFEGLAGGETNLFGGGGIGGDSFDQRGRFLVVEQAQSDEGDHADFRFLITRGVAHRWKNPGILNAHCGFDDFDPFDSKGIGDFGEQDVEAPTVVETGEREGSHHLRGPIF